MEKNRKQRFVAIIALTISLMCLSIGFAAFSTTLNISSQTTVSPNAKDFNVMIYGFDNLDDYYAYVDSDKKNTSYLKSDYGFALTTDYNTQAESLIINNQTGTILIPTVTILNEYTSAQYPLVIKNEGKYTAYLDTTELYYKEGPSRLSRSYQGLCKAAEGTTQALVDLHCQTIINRVETYLNTGYQYNQQEQYYEIPAGGQISLLLQIGSSYYQTIADGPFTVEFPEIKFNFKSAK